MVAQTLGAVKAMGRSKQIIPTENCPFCERAYRTGQHDQSINQLAEHLMFRIRNGEELLNPRLSELVALLAHQPAVDKPTR